MHSGLAYNEAMTAPHSGLPYCMQNRRVWTDVAAISFRDETSK
jgi:hypothetical protein